MDFIEWIQWTGERLYSGGGIYWRLYHGALVPAIPYPCCGQLSLDEAEDLLHRSGAYLIRYTSAPTADPTGWWDVVCDEYDESLIESKKTRKDIRRAQRRCTVQRVDPCWVADNAYECYFSAFRRYDNAKPFNEATFRERVKHTAYGPFEYWAAFVDDQLAGYSECIIHNNVVFYNSTKLHPDFLKALPSYALVDARTREHVTNRKMIAYSGSRSIAHKTNYQEFIEKFGYKKQYCRLHVVYHPRLRRVVGAVYPIRGLLNFLPDKGLLHKAKVVLRMEEISRWRSETTDRSRPLGARLKKG